MPCSGQGALYPSLPCPPRPAQGEASPSPCCLPPAQPTSISSFLCPGGKQLLTGLCWWGQETMSSSGLIAFCCCCSCCFLLSRAAQAGAGPVPGTHHPPPVSETAGWRVDQPWYRPTHLPFFSRWPCIRRGLERDWVPSSDGPCVSGPSAAPCRGRQLAGLRLRQIPAHHVKSGVKLASPFSISNHPRH